jgi:hypothetical protein
MSQPESGRRCRQHLRATADSIAERAERVARLEDEKEHLPDDDPGVMARSREVDQLIGQMARESKAELELAESAEAAEETDRGRPPIH